MSDDDPVLVLDLGGVACRWLPDRRLVALAELSGLPTTTVDQLVFESGFDDAGERGRFDLDGFTAELARLLGVDPTRTEDLRTAWATAYEPDGAVLRIVRTCGLRTALLTNNGPLMEAALAHELAQAGSAFDHLLFTYRFGAAKPEPEAFAAAADALGVEPARLLFFDDTQDNVDGALAAGWQARRFTTALDLQAALSDLRHHS